MPLIPTFPVFFQLLTLRCERLSSLNVGTEDTFPGRMLKFGRHFERVEKISIPPRAILVIYTRARTRVWRNFF